MLDGGVIHIRDLALHIVLQQACLGGIGLGPIPLSLNACRHNGAEFFGTVGIQFLHFRENLPWIGNIASQMLYCTLIACPRLAQGIAMRTAFALKIAAVVGDGSTSHHGVPQNERGTLGLGLRPFQSGCHGYGVGAIDLHHIPIPRAIFHGRVFVRHGAAIGRELHRVAVVEHNEIRQPQISGDTSGFLRDSLLHTAVADKCVGLMGPHFTKSLGYESLGYCRSHGHHMALAQRAAGILYSTFHIHLGMARSNTAPLPERLQVGHGVFAREGQHRIEHGRHVPGVQEEPVARKPTRVIGVMNQKLGIKHVHKVGTTHGTARVARLGFFDHGGGKHADVVGRTGH